MNARAKWLGQSASTYPAQPATTYIALFTVAPAADGSGGTEVTGGSYARASIAQSNWTYTASTTTTPAQLANTSAINFATPTANWGTVVAFAIYDAASAGNMLYYGTLTASKVINSGDTVQFAASALTVSED